ncbi:MAG: DUF4080 domain-containing protein [Acidaminococcaceae bacterium]|nr:DUF4080 domain-containing protein [Acidaminococcaceae bacterium]
MQAFFVGINSKYIHTALGIRYVTEYCRTQGCAAHMLEATVNEPILSVLTRITEKVEACVSACAVKKEETYVNNPTAAASVETIKTVLHSEQVLIGLEVHIWNRKFVLELAELLRKVLPKCLLLLGGPEVMFHPAETLTAAPYIDFIVCGEGEEVVADFLRKLAEYEKNYYCHKEFMEENSSIMGFTFFRDNKSEWKNLIPHGIAYRDDNGSVIVPQEPLVVKNLDILPFPYPDLDEVVAQHKIVYYEASRGCPFHCAYCLSGISHSVRRRSLALVLADMDRFMAAGAKLIKFVDRTYNLDESYYLPMLRYLAEAETDATFHFEIKADILSPEAVAFLKTVPVGRFQLEIGVQSTNPQVLAAIGRKDNWVRLKQNVTELIQAGNMHIHMDLIAGLPLEDLQSFARSFDDVYGLRPQALQLGFLKVLPGTVMDRTARQHGLVYMSQPPYEILSTNYVSYQEIRFLKILEEVFDLTANSGRFPFTLAYLVRQVGNGSAFSFFAALTEWYRGKGLVGVGHNGMEAARMLFTFMEELFPEMLFSARELLRLDVLQHMPNFKPEWLGWRTDLNYETVSAFWRDEEAVRKYLPDYSFKNWRALHKMYALEELLCDPWTGEKKSVFVLVNYRDFHLTRIESNAIIIKPSINGGTLRTE